jgi:hypothetical protein
VAAAGNPRHVRLAEDGDVVAVAEVEPLDDPNVVRASLHTEAGHLPVGTRSRLVDAVLDLPETRTRRRLEATLPLGDVEALDRLRARCEDVETRPAGVSCLVDAELPTGSRSDEAGGPE